MRRAALATLASGAAALHEHAAVDRARVAAGRCVPPGTCTAPATKYSKVAAGPRPGQQWNIDGGFCGAWSTQQCALSAGAWISQDLVRKANRKSSGQHKMHGDATEGYEVLPGNIAFTAEHLKLNYDEFDYSQAKPQAAAFKAWLKSHLVRGEPIVWFPMCKGDSHTCYGGGDCPNGGHVDHVEPIFGIYSDKPLSDTTVYPDDYVVHGSDQDLEPYYRKMQTLEDGTSMEGNCKNAGAGFGKNEMYPCFYDQVTYGLAVTGVAVEGTLPVSLSVDLGSSQEEPNVRQGRKAANIHGTVTVSGLTSGGSYVLYRYNSTSALPAAAPFKGYEHKHSFTADDVSFVYADPHTFPSDSATYYVAAEA